MVKNRPPRIYVNNKGKYVRVNNKRVYIKTGISNKQLVNVFVNSIQKRKRKKKKKSGINMGSALTKQDDLTRLILLLSLRNQPPPTQDRVGVPGNVPQPLQPQVGPQGPQGPQGLPGVAGQRGPQGGINENQLRNIQNVLNRQNQLNLQQEQLLRETLERNQRFEREFQQLGREREREIHTPVPLPPLERPTPNIQRQPVLASSAIEALRQPPLSEFHLPYPPQFELNSPEPHSREIRQHHRPFVYSPREAHRPLESPREEGHEPFDPSKPIPREIDFYYPPREKPRPLDSPREEDHEPFDPNKPIPREIDFYYPKPFTLNQDTIPFIPEQRPASAPPEVRQISQVLAIPTLIPEKPKEQVVENPPKEQVVEQLISNEEEADINKSKDKEGKEKTTKQKENEKERNFTTIVGSLIPDFIDHFTNYILEKSDINTKHKLAKKLSKVDKENTNEINRLKLNFLKQQKVIDKQEINQILRITGIRSLDEVQEFLSDDMFKHNRDLLKEFMIKLQDKIIGKNKQEGSGNKQEGLYDDQIENIMNKYKDKGYVGVYASDQLNKVPIKRRLGFIMNTDPLSKPGKHWVAVYIDARPSGDQSVEYYDSYGDEPTNSTMKYIKSIVDKLNPDVYLKFKVNRIKQQSVSSDNCGYFAMRFLMDRFNDKEFKDCSGYSDVIKSEKKIRKFKESLNKKFTFL
jgi:hypothetical protein